MALAIHSASSKVRARTRSAKADCLGSGDMRLILSNPKLVLHRLVSTSSRVGRWATADSLSVWAPSRSLACLFFVVILLAGVGLTQAAVRSLKSPISFRDDCILIQPKTGTTDEMLASFHRQQQIEVLRKFAGMGRMEVLRVPEGETVRSL